jgi:hypothetical protein
MSAADTLGLAMPFSCPAEQQALLCLVLRDEAVALVDSAIADTYLLALRFSVPLAHLPLSPSPDHVVGLPNTFRRRGAIWQIVFEGSEFFLHDMRGLAYLHHLLAHPHAGIHVEELILATRDWVGIPEMSDSAARANGLHRETDLGPLSDPETTKQVKKRLKAIEVEMTTAERFHKSALLEDLKLEKVKFERYLAGVTGLGGRPRRAGSQAEKARQSCRGAIVTAIKTIERESPALARHLRAHIHTGTGCSYEPSETVIWQL